MANSQLTGKYYKLPSEILNYIKKALISYPSGEGVRRANFLLKNGSITYESLKRIKNFFDTFNPTTNDNTQYYLAGGKPMKDFINQTLENERNATKGSKEVKREISQNLGQDTGTYDPSQNLREGKEKKKENALAVIVDKDNKFLLLKRAKIKNGWGNEQYGLAGGMVEKNESPEEACKREVKEETGIEIKKIIKTFTINRDPKSVEYVFACRFDGDPMEIELNDEHTNYGWYDIAEIGYLDTVPNLREYLILAFTDYDK